MSLIAKKKALFISSFPTFLESENFYINFDNIIQKTQNIFKKNKNIKFLETFFLNETVKIKNFKSIIKKESFFDFYRESLIILKNKLNRCFNLSFKIMFNKNFGFNSNYPLKPILEDFFLKDSFTKNSKNLLLRSQEIRKNSIFLINKPYL